MILSKKIQIGILGVVLPLMGSLAYVYGCRIGLNFLCRSDYDPRLTFADYCQNQGTYAAEINDTVKIILSEFQSENCQDVASRLQKEEKLNFSRKQIRNIYPLNKLSNVRGLMLYENQIADIRPLETMTGLEWLNISVNEVSDIEPLSELKALKFLDVSSNSIESIRPLKDLTELRVLRLDSNPLADVSSIKSLKSLAQVDYYEGFSAQAIHLGRSIAKTEENCPTQDTASPALKAWCQSE